MELNSPNATFVRELRHALRQLYSWAELRSSPLVTLLGVEEEEDPALALRRCLTSAIDALKPAPQVPLKAKAWRTHHLLYARFTEQFSQGEAASDLGLSVRHLRREETLALRTLAAYLWNHYSLGSKRRQSDETERQAQSNVSQTDTQTLSRRQELSWLEQSLPVESVDVEDLVQAVVNLLRPLAEASGVRICCRPVGNFPLVTIQRIPVRQALLTVCATALSSIEGGQVVIEIQDAGPQVRVAIEPRGQRLLSPTGSDKSNRLGVARQLVEMSGGALQFTYCEESGQLSSAVVTLPSAGAVRVLVIDDNVDTLRLIERYLSSSRYAFIGTRDPEQAVRLASEVVPRMIVLDVMLPGIDGWELLGRLSEHPRTRGVPIVVCSIVPQEQLARSLGATGFVHKPISRQALLSTLDDQLELSQKQPRRSR